MSQQRSDVGILGATGLVGQQLVKRLEGHPWFRLSWISASERSEGRRYGDIPWLLAGARPEYARDLRLGLRKIDGATRRFQHHGRRGWCRGCTGGDDQRQQGK